MAALTSGRQSPFRRQPSTNSPSPLRASTPSSSPTKPSLLSPARVRATSPDKSDQLSSRATQQQPHLNHSASPTVSVRDGRGAVLDSTNTEMKADGPVRRLQNHLFSSPSAASPSPVDRGSLPASPSTQIFVPDDTSRPSSSLEAPMRQPVFKNRSVDQNMSQLPRNNGNYNNIPAPLLRSLRESFEVLDPNATGSLNATALPPVLDQIGLPVDGKTLSTFFPPNKTASMNLASYLDMLCGPISQLSSQDELAAAFGAFDVDDSGQIDVNELKQALLRTVPEPGETNPGARLAEGDIDAILQNFTGRRAFGSRNTAGGKGAPASRGEVFKWRDFVNSVNGSGSDARTEAISA